MPFSLAKHSPLKIYGQCCILACEIFVTAQSSPSQAQACKTNKRNETNKLDLQTQLNPIIKVKAKNLAREDTTLTFPLKELLKFLDARF